MNIKPAMRKLELYGGHIYRLENGKKVVAVHRWKDELWEDFLKCRVT